jgi:hypothetical protein
MQAAQAMAVYQVDVSNVGTVWSGNNPIDASREFNECKSLSESNYGRFAGEDVTMFRDGEIWQEFFGTLHDKE